ncbi:MAG TPA: hypothetical protein VE870_05625 [Bacteroidales bacterium]|nr:hypothetical protein [Bacteroidales bacterium]
MDRKEIDRLLHKYYAGESSLGEESILRNYFTSGEKIPADLAAEKELFTMYGGMTDDGLSKDELAGMLDDLDRSPAPRSIRPINRQRLLRFTAIAASVVIILSVYVGYHFIGNDQHRVAITDTYQGNPELAYNETKEVLLYVSEQFNKGTGELSAVSAIREPVNQLKTLKTMDAGLDKLEYLDRLKNTDGPKGN